MTQTSTSVAHRVIRPARRRRGLREALLPVMALLGAVYGWVAAVLALIIVAIVLLIS